MFVHQIAVSLLEGGEAGELSEEFIGVAVREIAVRATMIASLVKPRFREFAK